MSLDSPRNMQKALIVLGALLIACGILWPWISKLGLGRLPGDIRVQTENGVFYFPLTTCIVISLVLSLVWWLLRR
jgi:ribose/xylose/arabinose/galactoside ABC-type transport system permease subunit